MTTQRPSTLTEEPKRSDFDRIRGLKQKADADQTRISLKTIQKVIIDDQIQCEYALGQIRATGLCNRQEVPQLIGRVLDSHPNPRIKKDSLQFRKIYNDFFECRFEYPKKRSGARASHQLLSVRKRCCSHKLATSVFGHPAALESPGAAHAGIRLSCFSKGRLRKLARYLIGLLDRCRPVK
jgi:hypothetical protein